MLETWIIPCNVRRFNVIEHFKNNDTVVWKNSFTIHAGDTVYIYLGSPYGEIRYRCLVIGDIVDAETLQNNKYAIQEQTSHNYYSKQIKYIQMKLEREYPEGSLPLATLREHGLGQVQIQARPDRNLRKYLDSVDKNYTEEGVVNG